ncbi:MAG: hypothetical protein P4L74_02625 [Candidatus Doudnabacteria bacterium]|nr:hypothetical protein [Candidatus Doudnabacteria bacterium]
MSNTYGNYFLAQCEKRWVGECPIKDVEVVLKCGVKIKGAIRRICATKDDRVAIIGEHYVNADEVASFRFP